ncbi:MAG TPA: helix-turn-helix domain-containing protein [Pyrinomonadaceae bacterium]|jgi:AraC-like DNA-binding protein/preprotein translocase subunit SecG
MRASLNLLLVLNLLGTAQALLLACALLSIRRGNRTANRLLAAFAAVIAVSIGGVSLSKTPYIWALPHLRMVHQPFYFLGAPLLFLYVKTLLSRASRFKRRDLLHFIPFGLCVVYLLPFYLQSGAAKPGSYAVYNGVQWFRLKSGLLLLQFIIYLGLIVLMLVRRSRAAAGRDSAAERGALFQARFLLATFLALWVLGVLHFAASLLSRAYFSTPETDLIVPLGITAFVYALAYVGLRKPEALTGASESPPPARKYEKSNLTPERSERYVEKLLRFMETEKPYTDSALTLQKLAAQLSIPERHLSRIINERLKRNFADFVNSYRVEEAKRRLVDLSQRHYSVLAIAEEVGFNSKSSFNLVFKKHTNMTPSEFRKAAAANGSR